MNFWLKIKFVVLVLLTLSCLCFSLDNQKIKGSEQFSRQDNPLRQKIKKKIVLDLSHRSSNTTSHATKFAFFVERMKDTGHFITIVNKPTPTIKEVLTKEKPDLIIIDNPWIRPYSRNEQESIIEFIYKGGGLLYIKPRTTLSGKPCLDLSSLGYFSESGSQIFPAKKRTLGTYHVDDTSVNITKFTDTQLFQNVKKLPYLGNPIRISKPLTAVAWTGENTFLMDTGNCLCYEQGCTCNLNTSTKWGPFPVIAKGEYGNGRILIISGTEEYIEDNLFKNMDVQNFIINSLNFLMKIPK